MVMLGGTKKEGTFHGIYQFSKTHGASALVGGFPAGTNAYPVAVVEINGGLMEVRVNQVQFTGAVEGGE